MAVSSDQNGRTGRALVAAALLSFCAVAIGLRAYRAAVPFQSGDYASMPYMVSYWYGWSWVVAHIHGPLLPAIVLLFAKSVVAVGATMTETLWRLPLAVVGTLHVPVAYLLMRRLGTRAPTALLAAAMTAVLPSLTNDARYPWGYETLAVCVGSLAIWAHLSDLDRPTRLGRWLAGACLGLYLVSHLVIHAVPLVILTATLLALGFRRMVRRFLHPSMLLPVLLAVAVVLFAFFQLHGGILGRMSRHVTGGTLSIGASSVTDVARYWVHHLGPVWAAFCGLAVVVGLVLLVRGDRLGLPALWAVLYFVPLMVLLNIENIGRPTTYMLQGTYAATLAGCVLLERLVGWTASAAATRPWPLVVARGAFVAFGVAVVVGQLIGSASNLFTRYRWPLLAGTIDYGRAVDDPGFKAAGWTVRRHVPDDAVVLATHTMVGLEYPCATYYLGRHVAATEDTTAEQERAVIEAVRGDIDVAVVEPSFLDLFGEAAGFNVPVRILRDGRPILYVAARRGLDVPSMDVDVRQANAAYDEQCRLSCVPTSIARLPRTAAVNQRILALMRQEPDPSEPSVAMTREPSRSPTGSAAD